MKNPKRAIRRQHRERLLKNRKQILKSWGYFQEIPEKILKKLIDTPKPCSCPGCGNPRNSGWVTGVHSLTMQERKFLEQDLWKDLEDKAA